MANDKVTIRVSLDQALVESLDRLAAQSGEARSELIAKACERFVAARALTERSPEEAIELTRAFIEANRNWLGVDETGPSAKGAKIDFRAR